MKRKTIFVAATALVVTGAIAEETRTVTVDLDSETSHETFEDSIQGDESLDYVVPAKTGEHLSVRYRSDNMGSYIDVYPPGSDEAMHVGSRLGNRFEDTLAETGDYRVHVHLMPNAAHRGEIAEFTIEFRLGGGEDDDDPSRHPDEADCARHR